MIKKITFSSFKVTLALAIGGILTAESFYLSLSIAKPLLELLKIKENIFTQQLVLIFCAFTIIIVIVYIWLREGFSEVRKMAISLRFDLLISFGSGIFLVQSAKGLASKYYPLITQHLSGMQVLIGMIAVILLGFILILRVAFLSFTPLKNNASFFINDKEILDSKDDLLNIAERSLIFSEQLYNGGANDSIVFGVDAPWGLGKSSFLNFSIQNVKKAHKNKVIFYKFDLLKNDDPSTIQEKFFSGLANAIQKEIYAPELSSLLSRYSRIVKGKIGFTFFGLRFDPNQYGVEEVLNDLEILLTYSKRKIIIVIDDLDRLDFSTVKTILFSIKKSFSLPNLTYVLCYDTENIANLKDAPEDKKTVAEFLEKFINVKFNIFLGSSALSNYVLKNFEKVVSNNLHIEPGNLVQLNNVIHSVADIYNSKRFYEYRPFLNDIRKLKRFINVLTSLNIQATDFENSDINKSDLIHLLLIYVTYPNIFRKIYNTESEGRWGFFSLITRYDQGYPEEYKKGPSAGQPQNSPQFLLYVKDLSDEQIFLIDKVFSTNSRFLEFSGGEPDEEARRSFACFNGRGGTRNLEQYLRLIVNSAKPNKVDQYAFYRKAQQKFKDGVSLAEIFGSKEFINNELAFKEFWKITVNSAAELSKELAYSAINYLIQSLPTHSLIEENAPGVGLRQNICRYILIILNGAGWNDENGQHRNNADENIIQIADKIFAHRSVGGILEEMLTSERSALGVHDALIFRLSCSANRSTSLFNVSSALSLSATPPGPTVGDVNLIAIPSLRKLSQLIFEKFHAYYIQRNLNFLAIVAEISDKDFGGSFQEAPQRLDLDAATYNNLIHQTRNQIASFCIYQLGNSTISSGIGCGFYDETGSDDQGGIRLSLNEYLFNVCFNPDHASGGYEFFLDYLLLCFSNRSSILSDVNTYAPSINEFTRVLDPTRLSNFWWNNRDVILSNCYELKEKYIFTFQYTASYADDLRPVFDLLDTVPQEN